VVPQLRADLDPGAGVERGERFVEQQQPGIGDQGTCQRDRSGNPMPILLVADSVRRVQTIVGALELEVTELGIRGADSTAPVFAGGVRGAFGDYADWFATAVKRSWNS
jgi:hypothetical protein